VFGFRSSYIAEEKLKVFLAEVTECKKLLNSFINCYQRLAGRQLTVNRWGAFLMA